MGDLYSPERKLQFEKFASGLVPRYKQESATSSKNKVVIANYDSERLTQIVSRGSIEQKRKLSQDFFYSGTLYTQIINYYTNLHNFQYFATSTMFEGEKTMKQIKMALEFAENLKLEFLFRNITRELLTIGGFYGILILDKATGLFYVMPIPYKYVRTVGAFPNGLPAIEFNISFFSTLSEEMLLEIFSSFPDSLMAQISAKKQWLLLPSEVSVCFEINGGFPPFLKAIEAEWDLEEFVQNEKDSDLEGLKKIISHKIPIGKDGELFLTMEEAQELHDNIARVLGHNKYIDVITSFGDVEILTAESKISRNSTKDAIDRIPLKAGMSKDIFMPTTAEASKIAIQKDSAFAVSIGQMFNVWLGHMVKKIHKNLDLFFLPITYINQKEYFAGVEKDFSFGFNKMLVNMKSGLKQSQIIVQLEIEKAMFGENLLVPPQNSNTLSGDENPAGVRADGEPKLGKGQEEEK